MISVLLLGFIAGFLAISGVPHFLNGIAGHKYRTPFTSKSSAVFNVGWGWVNWVAAVLAWHVAPMSTHPRVAFVSVSLGVLAMGLLLAQTANRSAKA